MFASSAAELVNPTPDPTIDYELHDGLSGAEELALVHQRLAATQPTDAPRLLITRLTGDGLSLGRHQRAASSLVDGQPKPVLRRLTGGRVCRYGTGQVSICLIVPDLFAFSGVMDPIKVINRGVRGLLRGIKQGFGLRAIYGGRDVITVQRQPLALLSMEALENGVCMFQAVLGLDVSADPAAEWVTQAPATGIGGEPWTALTQLSPDTDFSTLANAVLSGYQRETKRSLNPVADPSPVVADVVDNGSPQDLSWSTSLPIPIGQLQAGVALVEGRISHVAVCGDFITGSNSMSALASALVGVVPNNDQVGRAVNSVFAQGGILGVTALGVIRDAILNAANGEESR
jgi:hypothetical protein